MPTSLSVIMPNYNDARYLPQSLDALLSQSRQALEVIVVDDGSTDESVAIIEQFAARHTNLRLLRNERNIGVVASVNRALDFVNGDFVHGASANDYVLPLFFERALQMADRYPLAGTVFGKVVNVDPTGKELETRGMSRFQTATYVSPNNFLRDCLEPESPGHSLSWATLYRRDCLAEIGWWREELSHSADTFSAAAIGLKHGAVYIPERFACCRVSRDGFAKSASSKHMLDVVARNVYLMRSEQFRAMFPESYVSDWERQYRLKILKKARRHRARAAREAVLPAGRFHLLGRAFEKVMKHMPTAETRRLKHYQGDLSCFDARNSVNTEEHQELAT